jgi:hypothetical protein
MLVSDLQLSTKTTVLDATATDCGGFVLFRLINSLLANFTPTKLSQWFTAIGGRRFWLVMVAGAGNWVLMYAEKITPEIYRDVTMATVAAFIGGVTFQKHTQIKADSQQAVVTSATGAASDGGSSSVEVKIDAS